MSSGQSSSELPSSLRSRFREQSFKKRFNFSWIGGIANHIRGALNKKNADEARDIERQSEAALKDRIHSMRASQIGLQEGSCDSVIHECPPSLIQHRELSDTPRQQLEEPEVSNDDAYHEENVAEPLHTEPGNVSSESEKEPAFFERSQDEDLELDRVDEVDDLGLEDEDEIEADDLDEELAEELADEVSDELADDGAADGGEFSAGNLSDHSSASVEQDRSLATTDAVHDSTDDISGEEDAVLDLDGVEEEFDDNPLESHSSSDPQRAGEQEIDVEEAGETAGYDDHMDYDASDENIANVNVEEAHEAQEYNAELSDMALWEENGFECYDDAYSSPIDSRDLHTDAASENSQNDDSVESLPRRESVPSPEHPAQSFDVHYPRSESLLWQDVGFSISPGFSLEQTSGEGHAEEVHHVNDATTHETQTNVEPEQLQTTANPRINGTDEDQSNPDLGSGTISSASEQTPLPGGSVTSEIAPLGLISVGFEFAPMDTSVNDRTEPEPLDVNKADSHDEDADFEEEFGILAATAHRLVSNSALFGGASADLSRKTRGSIEELPVQPVNEDPEVENRRVTDSARELFSESSLFGGIAQKRPRDDVSGANTGEDVEAPSKKQAVISGPANPSEPVQHHEPAERIEPDEPAGTREPLELSSSAQSESTQAARQSRATRGRNAKPKGVKKQAVPERHRPMTRSMLRALEAAKEGGSGDVRTQQQSRDDEASSGSQNEKNNEQAPRRRRPRKR